MDRTGLYLYGIMAADAALAALPAGIGDAEVHPLLCGDFAALVSRVAREEADFSTEAVLAHEQVLLSAMAAGTVIPAAFGHHFQDEEALRLFVDGIAGELREKLDYLHDRVEVGVKAIWRKESFLSDIETPELAALIDQARQSPDDPNLTLAVGELVEKLRTERRRYYVDQICPRLAEQAVEMRLSDSETARVAFQAAFLIAREAEDAFFEHVEQVVKPYEDRLKFTGSGPWPPHNFVSLRVAPPN